MMIKNLIGFAFSVLVSTVAFGAEMQVAGTLETVRVIEVKLANPHVYQNLNLVAYDLIATVESSNDCMVPGAFVASGEAKTFTLQGVYAPVACPADMNEVQTEVLVSTVTTDYKTAKGDVVPKPQATVNGVPSAL